jgi:hypothetical protein
VLGMGAAYVAPFFPDIYHRMVIYLQEKIILNAYRKTDRTYFGFVRHFNRHLVYEIRAFLPQFKISQRA